MELIKKLFIKDYKNTHNEKVRMRYGVVAGVVGILTNLILFVCKIIIGVIGNSMSIITDAVNSLSDMSSSFITVFGFKLSSKPADEDHPYGYARYEYLSSLFISIIIIFIGALLFKSSIEKIISNEPTTVNIITFIILGISILLKLFQMLLCSNFGKAIDSDTLVLSSVDSRNDIISTFAVVVASVIIFFFKDLPFYVDGIFGLLVACFIIFNSLILLKETIDPLLGQQADKDLVKEIKEFVLSYDGIYGVHDLMVHNYGEKVNFTTIHAEVSSKADIMESHELIDNIEKDFKEKFKGHLTIHMDPIEIDNPEVTDLKLKIKDVLLSINEKLDLHDFRMVKGVTHTNLIFDIVVPFSVKGVTREYLFEKIHEKIDNQDMEYNLFVDIDK
ncbi:MAG: cation transporter [Clostridia bacterium]|nr:cation transporter [Clostridia bacterium]